MAGVTEFIERRKPAWDQLAVILARAGNDAGGVRRLSRDDLRSLGPLYRRACYDLAYARLRGADQRLVDHLNDLVKRGHGVLYAERGPGASSLWHFLRVGFPRLLRARKAYVLAALALFLLGAGVAAGIVAYNPANLRAVVPAQFADNDDYYAQREKDPTFEAPDEAKPAFAAGLMTNNIRVAILAFALGSLAGFPTLLLLFYNGMPLGGLAMQQHQHGRDLLFWSLILPHGIVEITAILIAGGAGMLIGRSLVAPGELSRRDAVRIAGGEAVRLLFGTVPLFIAAGFIESFITPTALPKEIKLGFAALTAVGLIAYFRAGMYEDEEAAGASPAAASPKVPAPAPRGAEATPVRGSV
jgi:uncharacterized membrane protein SpoIIM required for sporulation